MTRANLTCSLITPATSRFIPSSRSIFGQSSRLCSPCGTDLENPNFVKLAEAAGLLGLAAETPDQVRPMIAQALKHEGPALVEVPVSRQELTMPPTITIEETKNVSLFALKAVLSGRGDEIVDLARISLFR